MANEDNLAKLVATVSPLPSSGTLELEILQGAAKIRVWAQSEKGSEVLPGTTLKTWNLDDPAQRSEWEQYSAGGFWIEGVQASDTERDVAVNFRYRDPSGTTTCLDTVSVTVVMINLANAVYRDNDLWPERSRGHAAMVWKFVGPLTRANLDNDEFFRIIEMDGPTSTKTLTSITQGENPYGCFTNPSVTYVQRLKILRAAKALVAASASIGYTPFNALTPTAWNGKLDTITAMRCDGLIEVCYEINGVAVWGMAREIETGEVHYDITAPSDVFTYYAFKGLWELGSNALPDNLEEHNDFDAGWWADTLMPATQCGHVIPENADTRFQKQNLCFPIGSKGGN